MAKRPGKKRRTPAVGGSGATSWLSAPAVIGVLGALGAVLCSAFLSGSGSGSGSAPAASRACDVGLLQQWVEDGGGGLHPSLRVEVMPGTGELQRHVVARAGAVKAGEPLWHLPSSLLLRARGSWAPFRRLRSNEVDDHGRSPFALFAFDELEPALRTYRLAATLLMESERPGSNWTAYIACLPPRPCPSVFCATDAELAGLQSPTYVAEAQADRAAVERARGAIDWPGVAAAHGTGAAPPPSGPRWQWAVSTVLSRQFVRDEGAASEHELAPLGDLLNHAPETTWSPMAVKPGRRWSAPARDVREGSEVYLRYMTAGTPAWSVLRTYGYVNAAQHDVVMMGVNRDFPSPAVAAQVVTALQAIARARVAILGDTSVQAQLAFTAGGLDARTLAFCRILQLELGQQAMISDLVEDSAGGADEGEGKGKSEGKDEEVDEDEREEGEVEGEGEGEGEGKTGAATRAVFGRLDRAFSGKNEAVALQLMSDGLEALAGEFTTSLAADEAQLAAAAAARTGAGSPGGETRGETYLRFRILRKRTVKASQDAVRAAQRKLRSKYA